MSEFPLYLLLGVFCGLVSITLSRCTTLTMEIVERLQKATGLPKAVSPALRGLIIGLLALIYPEVLYWGFENVDILLESRPFTSGLSAAVLVQLIGAVLVQLIGVKVVATSLCRAFGLVGGYYAPSLFIGAATGMAYGKFMRFTFTGPEPLFHVTFLDVAPPQAYGLVGMAATLAGVCKRKVEWQLRSLSLNRQGDQVQPRYKSLKKKRLIIMCEWRGVEDRTGELIRSIRKTGEKEARTIGTAIYASFTIPSFTNELNYK